MPYDTWLEDAQEFLRSLAEAKTDMEWDLIRSRWRVKTLESLNNKLRLRLSELLNKLKEVERELRDRE